MKREQWNNQRVCMYCSPTKRCWGQLEKTESLGVKFCSLHIASRLCFWLVFDAWRLILKGDSKRFCSWRLYNRKYIPITSYTTNNNYILKLWWLSYISFSNFRSWSQYFDRPSLFLLDQLNFSIFWKPCGQENEMASKFLACRVCSTEATQRRRCRQLFSKRALSPGWTSREAQYCVGAPVSPSI